MTDSAETALAALVRPNVLALVPYRCARDDYSDGILLDANENAYGSVTSDSHAHEGLNRYPCPYQLDLKRRVAEFRGIAPENVFTGVGSDEAIDLLMRIFCVPGKDAILVCPPTYGMYKVSAAVNDVRVELVPLTPEFQLVPKDVIEKVSRDQTIRIVFLCSPNNPTANLLNRSAIEEVATGFKGIVVIDEAYIDFADEPSLTSLIHSHPNVVVLQTLSKSFGLAGIRCGFAMGHSFTIDIMNRVKAPYNISKMTSAIACEAFENLSKMQKWVEIVKEERTKMISALQSIESVSRVFPSDANFILFRIENAHQIYKTMANDGIVCRFRGNEIHCSDCLRVTVGTPEQNSQFVSALTKLALSFK